MHAHIDLAGVERNTRCPRTLFANIPCAQPDQRILSWGYRRAMLLR
jgi:hypothetical protein